MTDMPAIGWSRGDRGPQDADSRCPVRWRPKGVWVGELHRAVARPPDLHVAECEVDIVPALVLGPARRA